MFNCEMIPAENVGVKHAKWDKLDGYIVKRDCYNSYFYIVEDDSVNIIDKFRLHGRKYIEYLTGGSALHLNLKEHLDKEQYKQLLRVAAQEGCNYFTFNIPNTVCNDCGHMDKRNLKTCPSCKSRNYDVVFQEVPGEVTLAINISNCPNFCKGCHSPYLMENTGEILNEDILVKLLEKYGNAITCVCFMGGDVAPQEVEQLSIFLHKTTNNCIKTAWYSDKQYLPEDFDFRHFDFIKLGSYIEYLGGLGSTSTNQRFYLIENETMIDITEKFYKR